MVEFNISFGNKVSNSEQTQATNATNKTVSLNPNAHSTQIGKTLNLHNKTLSFNLSTHNRIVYAFASGVTSLASHIKNVGKTIKDGVENAGKILGDIQDNINDAISYAKLPKTNREYIKSIEISIKNMEKTSPEIKNLLMPFIKGLEELKSYAQSPSNYHMVLAKAKQDTLNSISEKLEGTAKSYADFATIVAKNFPKPVNSTTKEEQKDIKEASEKIPPYSPQAQLEAQRKKPLLLEQEIDRVRKNLKHVEQSPKEPVKNPFEEALSEQRSKIVKGSMLQSLKDLDDAQRNKLRDFYNAEKERLQQKESSGAEEFANAVASAENDSSSPIYKMFKDEGGETKNKNPNLDFDQDWEDDEL